MWLIDTQSLRLKEFLTPPPRYAILSHVWNKEEVTFNEFQNLDRENNEIQSRVKSKSGFRKIQQCCELAREQGIPYAWVDTCCIDKTSSAELSESINSMFAWYRASSICFAYLEDVESTTDTRLADGSPSKWYSRGWTLQELLAPLKVDFYNSFWVKIGSKWGMRKQISDITNIGEQDLVIFDRSRTSIAQKMSWASRRATTRVEDTAYCLLGIFGVYMPLLYGEGHNAFRRLQEELIRSSRDSTIFAWEHPVSQDPESTESQLWGVLAGSPRSFERCGSIKLDDAVYRSSGSNVSGFGSSGGPPFAITNAGLEIELLVIHEWNLLHQCSFWRRSGSQSHPERYWANEKAYSIALLDCVDYENQGKPDIGIALLPGLDRLSWERIYYERLLAVPSGIRMHCNPELLRVSLRAEKEAIYPRLSGHNLLGSKYKAFVFVQDNILVHGYRVVPPVAGLDIKQEDGGLVITLVKSNPTVAILDLDVDGERCSVLFGVVRPMYTVVIHAAITQSHFEGSYDMCRDYLISWGNLRITQEEPWVEHGFPDVGKTLVVRFVNIPNDSSDETSSVVYIESRSGH